MSTGHAAEPTEPLTPGRRLRPGVAGGTPVVMAGETWRLSDTLPVLGAVWDRLYDSNVLGGRYDSNDLRIAALGLLVANYRVSMDEAVALVMATPPAVLVPPVERALFGPPTDHMTFSRWVRSSLLANGLDPATVPPVDLHDVLRQLVATGRAVPQSKFISSVDAADQRRRFLALARARGANVGA